MQIRECTVADVDLLAELHLQLIEDERADGSWDFSQLAALMRDRITAEYKAFLFTEGTTTIGYALCDVTREPVCLQHFFICRDERRKGYGRQAIRALLDTLGIATLDIEVYAWNERGIAFWSALGFETRCYSMRLSTKGQ